MNEPFVFSPVDNINKRVRVYLCGLLTHLPIADGKSATPVHS